MAVWVAGSPTRSTVPLGTLSGMAASAASFGPSEPEALSHAVRPARPRATTAAATAARRPRLGRDQGRDAVRTFITLLGR